MTLIPKEHQNTVEACRYCPMCRHSCPSEFIKYRESDTPRGRAILLYNVYESGMEFDPSTVESMYNCFLCGACRSWCAGYELGGYDIPALVRFARRDIVLQGKAPAVVERIKNGLLENDNPENLDIRGAYTAKVEEKTAEVLFLLGPDIDYHHHEIAQAVERICRHLAVSYTFLLQEPDSGKILDLLGYQDEARNKARALANRIRKSGCRSVVVCDPLVYDVFCSEYKSWGISLKGIEILHLTEFLAYHIDQGKLRFHPINQKVTLLDSEFLGRYQGIYEAPLDVIKTAAGDYFVEMQWHGEYMLSSGEAAFTFDEGLFSFGGILAEKILYHATKVEAEILVTLSATAKRRLTENTSIEVWDIAEFVARRMIE